MCGDPVLDLLFLAVPGALLGIGAFFMMGKDKRKKIEEKKTEIITPVEFINNLINL